MLCQGFLSLKVPVLIKRKQKIPLMLLRFVNLSSSLKITEILIIEVELAEATTIVMRRKTMRVMDMDRESDARHNDIA
jgi:hypothetical protein